MTSSSKAAPRPAPPQEGSAEPGKPAPSPYARFIPREELGECAAWTPEAFHDDATTVPGGFGGSAEATAARSDRARQAGYQDGYRDGLAALESFKRSFAQQMSERIGQLVHAFDEQMLALEQEMARAIADTAAQLARQVVRDELVQDPQRIARVAQEALDALLLSTRHVTIHVHPDDEPLVKGGAGDAIAARGARLVADASIARGGCRVESDIGVIDATVATRWARALGALGAAMPFDDGGDEA